MSLKSKVKCRCGYWVAVEKAYKADEDFLSQQHLKKKIIKKAADFRQGALCFKCRNIFIQLIGLGARVVKPYLAQDNGFGIMKTAFDTLNRNH